VGRLCTLQENPHFWVPRIKVRPPDGINDHQVLDHLIEHCSSIMQNSSKICSKISSTLKLSISHFYAGKLSKETSRVIRSYGAVQEWEARGYGEKLRIYSMFWNLTILISGLRVISLDASRGWTIRLLGCWWRFFGRGSQYLSNGTNVSSELAIFFPDFTSIVYDLLVNMRFQPFRSSIKSFHEFEKILAINARE
jgi:hypothetical protein